MNKILINCFLFLTPYLLGMDLQQPSADTTCNTLSLIAQSLESANFSAMDLDRIHDQIKALQRKIDFCKSEKSWEEIALVIENHLAATHQSYKQFLKANSSEKIKIKVEGTNLSYEIRKDQLLASKSLYFRTLFEVDSGMDTVVLNNSVFSNSKNENKAKLFTYLINTMIQIHLSKNQIDHPSALNIESQLYLYLIRIQGTDFNFVPTIWLDLLSLCYELDIIEAIDPLLAFIAIKETFARSAFAEFKKFKKVDQAKDAWIDFYEIEQKFVKAKSFNKDSLYKFFKSSLNAQEILYQGKTNSFQSKVYFYSLASVFFLHPKLLKIYEPLVIPNKRTFAESKSLEGVEKVWKDESNLSFVNIKLSQQSSMERGPFRNLKNLKSLNLLECTFENNTLPDEFFEGLETLEDLYICRCQLVGFGKSFKSLKGLKSLTLNGNPSTLLKGVKFYLEQLPKLKCLTLCCMGVKKLGKKLIGRYSELEEFMINDLYINQLEELEPRCFLSEDGEESLCPKLRVIRLLNHRIRKANVILACVQGLNSLREIQCRGLILSVKEQVKLFNALKDKGVTCLDINYEACLEQDENVRWKEKIRKLDLKKRVQEMSLSQDGREKRAKQWESEGEEDI